MKKISHEIGLALLLAAGMLCAGTSFAAGNVWWVDDDNYGKSGLDGTTAEKAFGTIQDAINNSACTADDTIKVMPGTYDQDYTEITFGGVTMRMRVVLKKRLAIEAVGSKDETHIVGRFCPVEEGGNATYGTGPTAIRCVLVATDGSGSSITGFTLRDGATTTESSSKPIKGYGGAFSRNDTSVGFYVVNCVISNCVSISRGGAAFGGTFIRCLVSNCRAQQNAAFISSSAINCVFAHCSELGTSPDYRTLAYSNCNFVNCTIYGNHAAEIPGPNYNCLFLNNYSVETPTPETPEASNVYASDGKAYRNAEPIQLFAPALGDFHPLLGSAVFGAGDTRYLTTDCPIALPEGMVMQDMDGNPIDLTGEHVAAGAYQSAKTPQYGGVFLDQNCYVNGFPTYGTNQFFATSWPMSVCISNISWRIVEGSCTGELHYRFSGKGNRMDVTPPYEAGAVERYEEPKASGNIKYVDAVNGSDETGTGKAAAPYKTLQKAIDGYTASSKLLTIYLREGDYCEGGEVNRGVTNRFHLSGARFLLFVATGARERTIIRGAAAKNERDPVNHPGCGPDAVRCVSFSYSHQVNDQTIAFRGITFADGHTDVGQNAADDMGGAAFGRIGKRASLQFIDCVFTNCYAPAAGIATQAYFTRCRFIDCGGATDGFRDSVVTSSIVEDGRFGTGVIGSQTCAIGCSIAGSNAVAAGCEGQIVLNTAAGEGGAFPASAVTFGSTARSCFADPANGDFRPVSGSPALDAARREYPVPGDSGWDTFASYLSDFASGGFDGEPWIMSGGHPIAGACMEWVGGVSLVMDDASGYAITGGKAGGNVLLPGDSLTIARSPTAARKWGIVVDGVTNTLDKGSYVYAYDGTGGMNDGAIYPIRLPMGICISFR